MVSFVFLWTQSSRPHCGPGVDSACNTNEYQDYFLGECKGGRCLGLTTLRPSCADFLEIWEPQIAGTLGACNGPAQGLLYVCVLFFLFLFRLLRKGQASSYRRLFTWISMTLCSTLYITCCLCLDSHTYTRAFALPVVG
jgi:hypothetical protein